MRLHSVKLTNYKSISGDENYSKIIIEPNITVIIGKNESGKSNIISGLERISFTNSLTNFFSNRNFVNRNNKNDEEIAYVITLKMLNTEDDILSNDTIVTIDSRGFRAVGGILEYYTEFLKNSFYNFYNYVSENPFCFSTNEISTLKAKCSNINVEDYLDIPTITATLKIFQQWKSRVPVEKQNEYDSLLNDIVNKWNILCNLFPLVFYRDDSNQLFSEYRGDTLNRELENKGFLYQFIEYLGFNKTQIKQAVSGKIDGRTFDIQDRIQEAIDEKVNKPFHEFYDVEEVNLKIKFNTNALFFNVKTPKESTMLLGERSDGLKWYLNLFIDLIIHNHQSKNVVFLFDEPGISLHVNAQKKLLELFNELASRGHQVIYTTHSPFMLDVEKTGVEQIRATVKDEFGNTKIYKSAYDIEIPKQYRKDTLTPILHALGMGMGEFFGPTQGKFNIVTEGMSDCIFFKAIGKILKIDMSQFSFIPVVGASNVINICTILYGWGCDFLAIFDYDNEGVEKGGKIFENKYNFICNKNFIYLKDVKDSEFENKTYKTSGVEIEDLVSDLESFKKERNYETMGKTLVAKFYKQELEEGLYQCSNETLENFKKLFDRIIECYNKQN